eukprot:scaffold45816_cov18-Prasinocladus_malaysianus.AAC.1
MEVQSQKIISYAMVAELSITGLPSSMKSHNKPYWQCQQHVTVHCLLITSRLRWETGYLQSKMVDR